MSGELHDLQRQMAAAVMQPLTLDEKMRRRDPNGRDNHVEAAGFIRPNDRLASFERLEIYNRQYWFRVFSSFEEDFPGLQAVLGRKKFQALMRAYLESNPSTSFSLRNLGSKLISWSRANPQWIQPLGELATDMILLEWAHIESFDSATRPNLPVELLATISEETRIALQPHVFLLKLHHAVDDALIALRSDDGSSNSSSNNAKASRIVRRYRTISGLDCDLIYLAVHRFEDTVYYKRLGQEDFYLLRAIKDGKTLMEAIDAAFESSSMPEAERPGYLQSAFQHWMSLGWLCAPFLADDEFNSTPC
jgi:hypothetical protein